MSTATYPHIELNADGVPIISGTTTKVVEIVLDHLAHHWDAQEIHAQHPTLALGHIHAALAYYYDRQQAMDDAIKADLREVAELRRQLGDTKNRDKLRRLGHLP